MSIEFRTSVWALKGALISTIIIGLFLVVSGATHAQTSSDSIFRVGPFEHHNVPGGIALVPTGFQNPDFTPSIRWKKRHIAAMFANNEWYAIVGLPLGIEAGITKLSVSTDSSTYPIAFSIKGVQYEEQRITITNTRKVNPAPLDMKRINRENARLKEVKAERSDTLLTDNFIWPVEGPISSTFGLKRFFNDQPRRPHGGIDIAMPTGTRIIAPADGVIIDTGEYFFNGNSVFIEHGLGVQTFYAHMDSIAVSIGDTVQQGDVIGTVGETGRVTGAHLHWSLGLNSTWVDPTLVLESD